MVAVAPITVLKVTVELNSLGTPPVCHWLLGEYDTRGSRSSMVKSMICV